MGGRFQATLVTVTVLIVAFSPAMAAAGGFAITVDDAHDLPARTVTVQEEPHVVSGTLRTDPGTPRTVEVSAPDEVYRVYVYNKDQQIEESRRGDGPGTFTFDFSGYEPGSYVLTISHDGDFRDVFPVVVSGYTVEHEAPARAEPGDSIGVEVDVTPTVAAEPPAAVMVIVADDDTSVRTTAEETDGGYRATVALAELDAGTYTVWAVAQGEEEAFDHQEVLGMSTPQTIEVAEQTPSGGSDGDGSAGTATTTTRPAESSPTALPTTTRTTSPATTDDGRTPTTDSTPSTDQGGRTVITPAASPPSPSTANPAAPGQPGFGALAALLAIVLVGLAARRLAGGE